MIETKSFTKITNTSNRKFGIFLSILFLILALLPFFFDKIINFYFLFFSIIFFIISIIYPNKLNFLNNLWFKFGILLGNIISVFVIFFIFFLIVTPIGIFIRLFSKEYRNLKFDNAKNSYWEKRKQPIGSMKNQY